jgi:aspartyl-tRNA(Asn)/glutamyl-tRNA(Gln) amidotransferase subunit B
MNSLRAVYKALQYEELRQAEALRRGERLMQETRGWVETDEVTVPQRSKEFAHDYRYFPEPDLPPLRTSRERVEAIRASLPELPAAKRARFLEQYGLGEFETNLLTEEVERANYYEAAVAARAADSPETAKGIANWMVGDLARRLNETGEEFGDVKIKPAQLTQLVELIAAGTISSKIAKSIFETMYASGDDPATIVERSGQTQISDEAELRAVIESVIAEQPKAVADFHAGRQEAVKFLVGQIMRATRGRANPKEATRLLLEVLGQHS